MEDDHSSGEHGDAGDEDDEEDEGDGEEGGGDSGVIIVSLSGDDPRYLLQSQRRLRSGHIVFVLNLCLTD